MVVRIRKHLYLKPRYCPDCGKICLFCRCYKAERCDDCHKRKRDRVRRRLRRYTARHADNYKYDKSYWRRRRRILKEHPYCALCGATESLTTHHVGGGDEHLTVLCDDCHQAYERWNNKRKVIKCRKKTLIGGLNLWKNTMRIVRFHCLMCYYRIRLRRALELPEARLAFASSVSGITTN